MKKLLLLPLIVLFLVALTGCSEDNLGARTSNFLKRSNGVLQSANSSDDYAIAGASGGVATSTATLYADVSEEMVYMLNVTLSTTTGIFYSSDGTAGLTSACASTTDLTVKNGLITACN